MAISNIAKPDDLSPAYNPIRYIYDGSNKNNTGYKYIFDIYESGTATKIGEYRVFPRYSDGYGDIDLQKLLSSKLTFNFNPTSDSQSNPTASYYKYDVKVGEEYVTEVAYTASLTQNGSYVTITATHAFQVGDQVSISQADGGTANPSLEGLFTVTAINTTVDFTVNSLWSEVTDATINGTVRYADNRKTVTRNITTDTNNYVFNGALPWIDFKAYDQNNYLLSANTDYLLTSMPLTGFYSTATQDLWINIANNSNITGFIYFQNSDGSVFKKAITNNAIITQVSVGAGNYGTLTTVSGSGTLVESTTTYYDFWFTNAGGTQWSQKYRVNIDTRCKIEDYEIAFLDRMGSFSSFAFQLRAYERGTSTKQNFNRHLTGKVQGGIWTYNAEDYGLSTFSSNVEKTLELNTNWMTEEMATYFEELISSPATFLKDGSDYVACIVTDSSFEVERQRNKNLIRKTITIKYANQNNINI